MSDKLATRLCCTVFFVGIANFAAFAIVASILGGDAVNGKVQDGHFYLGSHGRYTEVSQATYDYSRAHTHSVWVTHPLAIFAAFAATRIGKKK